MKVAGEYKRIGIDGEKQRIMKFLSGLPHTCPSDIIISRSKLTPTMRKKFTKLALAELRKEKKIIMYLGVRGAAYIVVDSYRDKTQPLQDLRKKCKECSKLHLPGRSCPYRVKTIVWGAK